MKVIGLTGGIGTGKSTVSMFLSELGATVLDADKVGHEALQPECPVCWDVISAFGKEILNTEGKIDRKRLGSIVFDSADDLGRLNRIVHPWIYDTIKARLEEHRKKGTNVVILEAALLIEANWLPLVDDVWITTAPIATVIQRIKGRENLAEEEILSRIKCQMPQEERVKFADIVINTDMPLDELREKVKGLWQNLLKRV